MRGRRTARIRAAAAVVLAAALGLTLDVGPAAADISVQRTDLGTLGGAFSNAKAANGAGQVAGDSQIAIGSSVHHAFLWSATPGMIDLGALPGSVSGSNAVAINDNGEVTGYSDVDGGAQVHPWIWTPATGMVDLGSLGGHETYPVGIDDAGEVFGYGDPTGDEGQHPWIWTQAAGMVDLGTLGGSEAVATASNNNGQLVGYSLEAGDSSAPPFLWSRGSGMIALPTLGGKFAQAHAVNASGDVAGDSNLVGESVQHAFYWTASDGVTDIGTLGGDESHVQGMNAEGQIVGYSDTHGAFAAGSDPFSWTQGGGMVDLGSLGGDHGRALAVNSEGQVAGYSFLGGGGSAIAFAWTPGDGMVALDVPGASGLPTVITDTGEIIGASTDFGTAQSHATIWQVDDGSTTVPFPPENAAAGAGDSQATLSWTAPSSDGGSPITGYTVHISPGGATVAVDPGTTQATVTGLDDATTYTFAVTASNSVGDSSPSAVSNAVTPAAGSPPPVVVSTTADPGETVTTDPTNAGPTADAPVTTAVTTPNGGQVTIVEGAPPGTSPSGFVIGGQEIDIVAPAASASSPLQLSFGLYPQPGQDPTTTTIFRAEGGGDPMPLPPCDPGSPGQAVPDPCVSSIGWDPTTTFIQVSILTSTASIWTAATPKPGAIKVIPRGFAPKWVKVVPGASVTWRFKAGGAVRSVSDQLGLGPSGQPLFDSGPMSSGIYTAGPFVASGDYPFGSDPKDVIRIPLETIPASGAPGSSVTLIWATSVPVGYAFDVRMRFKQDGTTRWSRWSGIDNAVRFTHTRVGLSDGAGTYRFEARLRNLGTGHVSLWSPVSDVPAG